MSSRLIVIGGGAAGFFGAIAAADSDSSALILEAGPSVLSKLRISGGGRCNVTHACFDPRRLCASYPRGGKELRGPFSRFQPRDTIDWFENQGVRLKTEADGRIFPESDDSATIVNCLRAAADRAGVNVRTETNVSSVVNLDERFHVVLSNGEELSADKLLLATGGSRRGFTLAAGLGHAIVAPVPSLFTLEIRDSRLVDLAGISVEDVELRLETDSTVVQQSGPLLVTHWGLSGPAVLKLSAWAARILSDANYRARLLVKWLPTLNEEDVRQQLTAAKREHAKRGVLAFTPFDLPRRLWAGLVRPALPAGETRWADVSRKVMRRILEQLLRCEFTVSGKGVFKEEFVTCGGIDLQEVDFRTMQSRLCRGLYFAGEILNVDGITGGFNFQNAWTTAWIAGGAIKRS